MAKHLSNERYKKLAEWLEFGDEIDDGTMVTIPMPDLWDMLLEIKRLKVKVKKTKLLLRAILKQ